MELIDKDTVVAEIERLKNKSLEYGYNTMQKVLADSGKDISLRQLQNFIDDLEVKEVDLEKEQRIKDCPFRTVYCERFEGTIVECNGKCSLVVDYPKIKEFKAQKGE